MKELKKAIKRGLQMFGCPPAMLLSEWAEKHFYLSAESSYVEKRWQAYPFQTAILDCMGDDEIEEVSFSKSARVGYTKMILAAICYFAEHKRRNQAIWQPTDEDADDFVKTELDTALRDVESMKTVFPEYMARHKNNTMRQKKFLGSMLHIRGGKAAKNYRRISVDVAILDELDGFDKDIEKEGSPDKLAKKRTEGATYPKFIRGSTPKLKLLSMIESAEAGSDLRVRFHVPCPHCDEYHQVRFPQMKWAEKDHTTAIMHCEVCGAGYSQAEYLSVWKRGQWRSDTGVSIHPGNVFKDIDGQIIAKPKSIGFHIWTAYSPQASWSEISKQFIEANEKAQRGDKSDLKAFTNTTLGESWEEDVEKTDEDALMKRAEDYSLRTIPKGGLILTAGIDTQDDRIEVVVWAFGVGEQMWVIDYHVITGSPENDNTWLMLDDYLQSSFQHQSGCHLKIEAAAIDTGGHHTHRVYEFCRGKEHRKIFAIKGDSKQGSPVKGRSAKMDINTKSGKTIRNGVKLWTVGTDTAKDLIHGRLQIENYGPGYMHFSNALEEKFYQQLTAEVRIPVKTASGEVYRWVRRRSRNEVLDCTVYAIFAAYALDIHRFTEKMWDRIIEMVQPATTDLFAPALLPVPDSVAAGSEKAPEQLVVAKSLTGGKVSVRGGRWK